MNAHHTNHTHMHIGGLGRPSIIRGNCEDVGILQQENLVEVMRGQAVPIFIGCDVCIQEAQEVWLTIECPTNVNAFPNTSVTFSWVDKDRNILQGVGSTLLVQRPGEYTCIADFGNNERDEESTTVGCETVCLILIILLMITNVLLGYFYVFASG